MYAGGKTYAEMDKEDKNAISHRGRSLAKVGVYYLYTYAVYMFVSVCVSILIRTYASYIRISVYPYIRISVYPYIRISVYPYVYAFVCTYKLVSCVYELYASYTRMQLCLRVNYLYSDTPAAAHMHTNQICT